MRFEYYLYSLTVLFVVMIIFMSDADDPSIDRVVLHFNRVIQKIASGTWKHFLPTAAIKAKSDAKVHGIYLRNLAGCLTYDDKPIPTWLERSRLKDKIFFFMTRFFFFVLNEFTFFQFYVGPQELYEI